MKGLLATATVAGVLAVGGTYVLAPSIAGDSGGASGQRADYSALDQRTGPAPWADGKAYWHAEDARRTTRVAGVARFATMGLWADCVATAWSRGLHAEKPNLQRACGPRPTPETRRGG